MTFLGGYTKNSSILKSSNLNVKSNLGLYNDFSPLKVKRCTLNEQSVHLQRYHTYRTNQLGYYLAGLIEGDGSIILRKGVKEKTSPKIVFTFSKNELRMYERLQSILNTGSINTEKTGICRYSVTNADAVINLINLVNGKFRTPKIIALYKAIDNLNLWRNANLLKLPLDDSSFDSNAWLAGFIDCDGHFSIKLSGCYSSDDSDIRGRVQCLLSINQSELNRVTGESNVLFMTKLAEFFQVNLNYKTENSPTFKQPAKTVVFYAQSDRKHYIIVSYLTKFPLMTSKHLNYLAFLKGLNYLGKRLTREEILEVRSIKNSMNNKRTEYTWDHLNEFYV